MSTLPTNENQNSLHPPDPALTSNTSEKKPFYHPIFFCPFSSDDPKIKASIFEAVTSQAYEQPSPPLPSSIAEPPAFVTLAPTEPISGPPSPTPWQPESTVLYPQPSALPFSAPLSVRSANVNGHAARPLNAEGEDAFRLLGCIAQPPSFSNSASHTANEYSVMEKAASIIVFVNINGNIYYFNGICYELLRQADALGKILDVCRSDIKGSGKYSLLKNAYQFLTVDSRFSPPNEWISFGKDYVTFKNGNLNWRTGTFEPHNPRIFTTYSIQADYLGPSTPMQNSRFMDFLSQAGGGSSAFVNRALEIIGYCIIPDTGGKVGILLQGRSNSGKTLMCNLVSTLFPDETISALSIHDLARPFAVSELETAVMCIVPDMTSQPLGEKSTAMVKALSGNDWVQSDRKYKSHVKFHFMGKFLMSTNHALLTKEFNAAFENRIVTLPFFYSFPREAQDPQLLEKMKHELDYIASLAVTAYFRLRERNYLFSGNFRANMPEALIDSSASPELGELINVFLQTYFSADPSSGVFVADAYQLFCQKFSQPMELAAFGRYFIASAKQLYGATQSRKRRDAGSNPTSYINGISLLPPSVETGGVC